MPTKEQLDARAAIRALEADAKHSGKDPVAEGQTRDDDINDPKHHAKDAKQDDRWKEVAPGVFVHPDFHD